MINSDIFQKLKDKSVAKRQENTNQRLKSLLELKKWIQNNENKIIEALQKDFNKPAFETQISEIMPVLNEINYYQKHLKSLKKEKKVPTPLFLFGHKSRIRYENKGVVFIISPWNYPFQLALVPMISALAAGNTVVIKPSEMTPHTSNLILKMAEEIFSQDEVLVELGAKEKTEELLQYTFDHVFFTGSTNVGRIVSEACAKRLIPVTLELGGKSPTIVDETADLDEASDKIFWGKFLNRGQTCVAPDYVFIHEKVYDIFKQKINTLILIHDQSQKAHIINEKHNQHLQVLSETQKSFNQVLLKVVENPKADSLAMKEEIFGPVLPIISYKNDQDVFAKLQFNETPLSLYVFSKRKSFIEQILQKYPSGSVGINSLIVQFANHHLPFGGLQSSGSGRYHGHFGFLEFSHQRAIIEQSFLKQLRFLTQPPYTNLKLRLLSFFK